VIEQVIRAQCYASLIRLSTASAASFLLARVDSSRVALTVSRYDLNRLRHHLLAEAEHHSCGYMPDVYQKVFASLLHTAEEQQYRGRREEADSRGTVRAQRLDTLSQRLVTVTRRAPHIPCATLHSLQSSHVHIDDARCRVSVVVRRRRHDLIASAHVARAKQSDAHAPASALYK
jgi:hypothetical protein